MRYEDGNSYLSSPFIPATPTLSPPPSDSAGFCLFWAGDEEEVYEEELEQMRSAELKAQAAAAASSAVNTPRKGATAPSS